MANLPKPKTRPEFYQNYLAGYGNFADLPVPNPDRSPNQDYYLYEQCVNRLKKTRQITDHCVIYNNLSDGVKTGVTSSMYYTAKADCFDIKALYGNFHTPAGTPIKDVDGINDITIKASLCIGAAYTQLKIYPLKFKGSDSAVLKPGAEIETDALAIELKEGDKFYIRTYVSVTSGQKFPTGQAVHYSFGEGETVGDVTINGTALESNGYVYHPLAIIGSTSKKATLLIGDSIFTNQTSSTTEPDPAGGYAGLALHNAGIPYGGISVSTDQVSFFMTQLNRISRMKVAKYYDSVISDYGVNDIANGKTVEQIKADLLALWNMCASRGLKVYHCTITPYTTSTDAFATTTNQTVKNVANEAKRIEINNWVRTKPAPLSDYFDIADLAETSRNSGIWKVGLTWEGLHPNATTGHTALSLGIDTSLFK